MLPLDNDVMISHSEVIGCRTSQGVNHCEDSTVVVAWCEPQVLQGLGFVCVGNVPFMLFQDRYPGIRRHELGVEEELQPQGSIQSRYPRAAESSPALHHDVWFSQPGMSNGC